MLLPDLAGLARQLLVGLDIPLGDCKHETVDIGHGYLLLLEFSKDVGGGGDPTSAPGTDVRIAGSGFGALGV
jgi:hypothetical protein